MTLEEALTPPQALNPEAAAEPAPEATPASEEQPAQPEPQAPEAPQEDEAKAEAPEVKEEKVPRAQRRIQDLSHQLKEAKEQLAQAQTPTWDFAQPTTEVDARTQYESGEITLEDYLQQRERQVLATSQLQTQAQIAALKAEREEEKFWTSFEVDTAKLEKSNPKFDPDNKEQFDQEYVDELSSLYVESFKDRIQTAPKLSEWVARIEKLRAKAEAAGQAASSATLADQAAQAAVGGESGTPPKAPSGKEALKQKALQTGSKEDMMAFFKEDAKRFTSR